MRAMPEGIVSDLYGRPTALRHKRSARLHRAAFLASITMLLAMLVYALGAPSAASAVTKNWSYKLDLVIPDDVYIGTLTGHDITAEDAFRELKRCFNCSFPIPGAPKTYPRQGEDWMLLDWPKPLKDLGFYTFPVRITQTSSAEPRWQFTALPGHADGAGSTIKFRFYSDSRRQLRLAIDAYVVESPIATPMYEVVAEAMWGMFLRRLLENICWYQNKCTYSRVGGPSRGDGDGRDPVTGGGSGNGSGVSGSGGSNGGSGSTSPWSPVGVFEGATAGLGGSVDISGWAFDPDAPTQPVDIHVYVGGPAGVGIGHNLRAADLSRPDVAKGYPAAGDRHGFNRTITGVPAGRQTIYVYAFNVGKGSHTEIGKRDVTIPTGKPFGFIDGAAAARDGTAQLDGWAIDPDAPTQPVDIHVYVDGPAGAAKVGHNLFAASGSRPDVDDAHPGAGDRHGFSKKISGLGPGKHTLYFYAINLGPGESALLGTREVTVPVALPFGKVDVGEGRFMGETHIGGWAIDPESADFQAEVHVYVDGGPGSGAQGFNLFGATLSRPDVAAAYPGRGDKHGFDRVLTGLAAGKRTLYVYAVGKAGSTLLATKQVTVGAGFIGAGGASVPGSHLASGAALLAGQALLSPKREYALVMQHDGNLVLYHTGSVIWNTATFHAGSFVAMQGDGNFVIYNSAARPVWATMTTEKAGASIHLQDDGNLVIYKGGSALWWRTLPGFRLL